MTCLFAGGLIGLLMWFAYIGLGQAGVVKAHNDPVFRVIVGHRLRGFLLPTMDRVVTGAFQRRIDEVASDNFPLWRYWAPPYFRGQRSMRKAALNALPLAWSPATPVGGDVVALRSEARLCEPPRVIAAGDAAAMRAQAAYYTRLAAEHPGVRFIVCPVLSAGEWLAVPPQPYGRMERLLAGEREVRAFAGMLEPRVRCRWAGEGLPPGEALALYYRTDHHLRMPGAYRVYRQLHDVLREGWAGMGPPCEPRRWFTTPGVEFFGSYARRAGAYAGIADSLEHADFAFPAMEVALPGREASPPLDRRASPSGGVSAQRFANHYTAYYGGDRGVAVYQCATAPERRLLVIGDSYDNCMESLLAQHYRNTHFVDLRHYAAQTGAPFDLPGYLRDHAIQDVLFFGDDNWLLGLKPLEEE